jgi:hypothetical protein
MPFFYRSGEQIKLGDRVRIFSKPAEIESIHDPVENPDDWFVKECGAGVLVTVFGRVYIRIPGDDYDELEFVTRGS